MHLIRRRYCLDPENEKFLQRAGANDAIMFEAASAVGRLAGWKDTVFSKDTIICDTMHANYTMQDPKKMPAYIRGAVCWKIPTFARNQGLNFFQIQQRDQRSNADWTL